MSISEYITDGGYLPRCQDHPTLASSMPESDNWNRLCNNIRWKFKQNTKDLVHKEEEERPGELEAAEIHRGALAPSWVWKAKPTTAEQETVETYQGDGENTMAPATGIYLKRI